MKELKFLSLVMVAVAALLLTACTSESESSPSGNISYESIKKAEQTPVLFSTYLGEQATTRYGTPGSINNTALKNEGFGVFGYYTNDGNYSSTTSKPNFMYNQSVTWDTDHWTYSPIKYWPNEYGNDAKSTGTDRLTFFAYAPYTTVTATASTGTATGPGNATSGIITLTGNDTGGDPKVSYTVATNPAESVDLLYGVVGTATNDGPFGTSGNAVALGGQYIDITKQDVYGKIDFDFKHALSRLNFTIQGAFDGATVPTAADVDADTKITVQSVVINGTNFYSNGVLDLNGGTWDISGAGAPSNNMTITTYLNPDIVDKGADDTHVQTESSVGADDGLFGTNSEITGIDYTEKTLTANASDYYMIIPASTTITGVTITYFVNTEDANLNAGYSRVKNVITKTIDFNGDEEGVQALTVEKGKAYKFKLVVGMTTVKIIASVTDWVTSTTEVWLPINVDSTPAP
jgi:hypothetical protein